ncbi:MAG: lysylphosphatidylglycerol synthase transmembrane domain-containing protein [Bacteroidia bacterium]|nr:lysylphosphatidylglycerol synthase transmembrane domain-containing protein [Bacteroidia bacterium]
MNFRKFVIQALKFLGFLAVGILLLWLAFRKVNYKSLTNNLKEANYYWLILSLFFSIMAFVLRARRWQLLIHPLGFRPSFWHTFHALMIGYLANLALPRIGEITRCVALGKKEEIAVDKLIGTVLIERTIDLFSVLLFLVIIIFTSGAIINEFLNESIFIPFKKKVFSILNFPLIFWALLTLVGIIALYLMIRYRKSLRKFRFFAKMFDIAKGVISGLKTITKLERKLEFIFLTISIWISYALMTWVVVFCLESTSHISFGDSLIILIVGGLAMAVPVQGGFGAFHYAVSRVLVVLQGVSLEDGLTYALLSHESQIVFEIIIGIISIYIMYGKNHKMKIAYII